MNKTGTSKVGAISKAQKAQKTLGFLSIYSVAKYQKTRKGDSFETLKNFRKSHTMPKKRKKIDPLVSSGFVGYVKKVKNERGTLLH